MKYGIIASEEGLKIVENAAILCTITTRKPTTK
ncbi:hypothetical protein NIES4106_09600 [Fischerella sp. NIES-4106]|jgi:hypothetical protein|nr:hypothetical protein NIES4106_09600 [Fischerella sp. NIES-4106]